MNNKEYDNFRTSLYTSRRDVPDYSKYRLDGKIRDSKDIPDYSKYRLDPKKDNSNIPSYDEFRKTEKRKDTKLPDYSNFRKDIKTVDEEDATKYRLDENGNIVIITDNVTNKKEGGNEELEHI